MKLIATALLTLVLPLTSHAAIFDAADILGQNSGAVGAFGEILLSDPTSEGVEARARYGLSDEWNVGALLGAGSKGKKFRVGGEAVYNVIPDWEGQFGLSFLGSAMYLNRYDSGGVLMRVGVMGHKKFSGISMYPATVYVAIPLNIEARSGNYTTGSQLVLGSLFDIAAGGRYYLAGEAGVKLGKSDSYILFGAGVRFGELRFERRGSSNAPAKKGSGGREYNDADFKK